MMRRRLVSALAAAAVSVTVAVASPVRAEANPYVPPSAYSTPVGTGTASLSTTLALSGTLGGLLDSLISPIVSGVLNPLLQALTVTTNATVSSLLGGSSSFVAGTPSTQSAPAPTGTFPNDLPGSLPSPCQAGGATPCYTGVPALTSLVSSLLAPVASVQLSALTGYTQYLTAAADPAQTIFGRAQIAGASISVLPAVPSLVNPLVSLGVADARATCPNNGTSPSADATAASVSLLGGLVTLHVAGEAIADVVVSGTTYASLAALPTIDLGAVRISPYGTAIRITVSLTPGDLLGALGLGGSIVSSLLGLAPTSSVALNVIVGPNSALTSTSAKAWALGVGVDLSGSLGFTLLGIVGANVSLNSGIGGGNYGNLLDLRLGYATCTVGSTQPGVSRAVPPVLV